MRDLSPDGLDRSTRPSKLMSLHDAVSAYVQDGDSIFLGYTSWAGALEREIVRQRKRHLVPLATVGSLLLPLAGCAERIVSAYLLGARSPWFMQRLAAGEFQIEDYTNQTIALMFLAGALGVPFMPTKSLLGSDYLSDRYLPQPHGFLGLDKARVIDSPFGAGMEKVALVPALRPSVSCVHVQWADEDGNAAFWGGAGEVRWALWASERIILSAEEIVPRAVLRSDPDRVIIPGFRVNAVVHLPYGALPWGLAGYYRGEDRLTGEYFVGARSEESFAALLAEWIDGLPDHDAFLEHLAERYGPQALETLQVNRTWEPVRGIRYGWRSAE